MKKIFTLCLFAFVLVLGTQSAAAQNKTSNNETAAVFTKELNAKLKLDQGALDKVYAAYVTYINKTEALDTKSESYTEHKSQVEELLLKNLQSALTADQYSRYLELMKQAQAAPSEENTQRKRSTGATLEKQ